MSIRDTDREPLEMPTRELMSVLVDTTGDVKTLRDLRQYAVFTGLAAQMVGRGLGVAVRTVLFDGAGQDDEDATHIEVMLDDETKDPDRTLPTELTMLLSSTLGQLREISTQLLVVESLVKRHAAEQAAQDRQAA